MTVPSRGAIRVEDLATAAGLDPAAVRRLVEAGEVHGLMDAEGRAVLVFDDALPSADRWRALGLSPADTYRPETLRSSTSAPDEEEGDEEDETLGSTWTMAWGPEAGLPEDWPGQRDHLPAEVVQDEGGQVVAVRTVADHDRSSAGRPGLRVTTVQAFEASALATVTPGLLTEAVEALVAAVPEAPQAGDLLPEMANLRDPRWVRIEAPPHLGGEAWRASPLDDTLVLVVRPAADVLVTAVGDPGLLQHGLVWLQAP